MKNDDPAVPYEILFIEDNPGDVRLVQETLKDQPGQFHLHAVSDVDETRSFLKRQARFADVPRPDLILLDLNLPKENGRDVLAAIKSDPEFRRIPLIVLTSSDRDKDIQSAYDLHANCYITKPLDLNQFMATIQAIIHFWFEVAKLPAS